MIAMSISLGQRCTQIRDQIKGSERGKEIEDEIKSHFITSYLLLLYQGLSRKTNQSLSLRPATKLLILITLIYMVCFFKKLKRKGISSAIENGTWYVEIYMESKQANDTSHIFAWLLGYIPGRKENYYLIL